MRKLFRLFKIVLGISLMGVSLWALLLPPYFPSSSHAVVNTRKIPVTSQIDGSVSELLVGVRSEVKKGQSIARVDHDLSELRRDIDQQGFQEKRLEAQVTNAELKLKELKIALEEAQLEYEQRQIRTVQTLSRELKGLESKLVIEEKELELLRERETRVKGLLDRGIVTRTKWLEMNNKTLETEKSIQSAIMDSNRVEDQLALARKGIYLASTDREDALTANMASLQYEVRELESEKSFLQLRLTETGVLIEASKEHLQSLQMLIMACPTDGLIWACNAVKGQNVSTGQSLVEIADSDSVFVEAFFHGYYQETIFPGDHAFVQIRGEGRLLSAIVTEVNAQENGNNDMYIVDAVAPSSSMLRVRIAINGDELSVNEVGRLGKVVVTSGQPGFINRSLVSLSMLLRNRS